jgi:ATP-dependent RNA helicase DeaD
MSSLDVPAAPSAAFSALPAALSRALERRGFTALTSIQSAVLAPECTGRDLRIRSRTGSGKTVALGLAVASELAERKAAPTAALCARPSILLIAPTRELAAQVGQELGWLYAELGSVCVVTGGTSTRDERRALSRDPAVVVGTPGRLCDHLERGALDLSAARAVVLDEADQMFELGFREAIELLLGALPEGCRTHLVSATFPRAVAALAARFQRDALGVDGEDAQAAHADITHVAHLVLPRERYAALVNVLLLDPELRTLIFVRTRADAGELAGRLAADGFRAGALSGELAQAERTRILDAFRKGNLSLLVCTDVAARGIDVPEVARVIHGELPDNAALLTHRSGRTGRAGRKGVSVLLVPAPQYRFAESLLRGANLRAELVPAPGAREVAKRREQRLFEELTQAGADEAASEQEQAPSPAASAPRKLVKRLIESLGAEAAVAALLQRRDARGPCAPHALGEVKLEPARRPNVARPDPRSASFPRNDERGRSVRPPQRARFGRDEQTAQERRANFAQRR